MKTLAQPQSRTELIMAAVFLDDENLITGDSKGNLCTYNVSDSSNSNSPTVEPRHAIDLSLNITPSHLDLLKTRNLSNKINSLDCNDIQEIVSVSQDLSIRIFDGRTLAQTCHLKRFDSIENLTERTVLSGHTSQIQKKCCK